MGEVRRAAESLQIQQPSALLRAKLRAPGRPEHYIRRQRLFELLDDVVTAPLTVVVAPAGAGKSLLLAGWMEDSAIATSWLSLDEGDRDGTQLWTGLIAALEVLAPDCGDEAVLMLRRHAALPDVVEQLLDQLLGRSCPPSVIVLDDVHLVDGNDDVATSLGLFLHHLPPWLHVVVLSRRDPVVPIDRLRARGQLGEVRFAELRFSRDEASDLLSRLAPSLSEEQIDATANHVEGWAVGLQMAALAARSRRAQQLIATGLESELLVDDYVWHEVLAARGCRRRRCHGRDLGGRSRQSEPRRCSHGSNRHPRASRASRGPRLVRQPHRCRGLVRGARPRTRRAARRAGTALTEPAGRAACPRRSLVRGRRRSANRTRALAPRPASA